MAEFKLDGFFSFQDVLYYNKRFKNNAIDIFTSSGTGLRKPLKVKARISAINTPQVSIVCRCGYVAERLIY